MSQRIENWRAGVAMIIARWCFVLLTLPGCAALPSELPGSDGGDLPQVRLEGTRGPLTAARSAAVLAQLQPETAPSEILQRHLRIEEVVVGSPLTLGNDVVLLKDGPATYRAMLAAIQSARDHINMETYIFDDDDIGKQFLASLIERQRHGVQVNLIHDSVGTVGTPDAFFAQLSASGARVLEFNPINPADVRVDWKLNQRDHRKLLIVDGRTAILGGINISSVYSGGSFRSGLRQHRAGSPAWRDTDLQLRGPVVAELQRMFLATWHAQRGEALAEKNYLPQLSSAGSEIVRVIGSSPDDPVSSIYATLLSAITHAEISVQMTNAYFAPDPKLLAALADAARRGVAVTLILPSRTDSWMVFHAGRGHYAQLLRAGVRIYERSGVILHSKTALIDGVWSTVGSTNLDWRSFVHNYELNAVVLGPGFGSQLQAMFAADLAASERIHADRWARRSVELRVKETLAQILAYWL